MIALDTILAAIAYSASIIATIRTTSRLFYMTQHDGNIGLMDGPLILGPGDDDHDLPDDYKKRKKVSASPLWEASYAFQRAANLGLMYGGLEQLEAEEEDYMEEEEEEYSMRDFGFTLGERLYTKSINGGATTPPPCALFMMEEECQTSYQDAYFMDIGGGGRKTGSYKTFMQRRHRLGSSAISTKHSEKKQKKIKARKQKKEKDSSSSTELIPYSLSPYSYTNPTTTTKNDEEEEMEGVIYISSTDSITLSPTSYIYSTLSIPIYIGTTTFSVASTITSSILSSTWNSIVSSSRLCRILLGSIPIKRKRRRRRTWLRWRRRRQLRRQLALANNNNNGASGSGALEENGVNATTTVTMAATTTTSTATAEGEDMLAIVGEKQKRRLELQQQQLRKRQTKRRKKKYYQRFLEEGGLLDFTSTVNQIIRIPYTTAMTRRSSSIPYTTKTSNSDEENVKSGDNNKSARITAYAPKTFANLRSKFGISESSFRTSILNMGPYVSFQSNSKGAARVGGFFFFTRDGAYMIKTIKKGEVKTFLSMLPKYYRHMKRNSRRSLLTRFCGMYSIQIDDTSGKHSKKSAGKEHVFVVMNSVFPAEGSKFISERYDLKGSTVGRECSEEEKKKKGSNAVLKDNVSNMK